MHHQGWRQLELATLPSITIYIPRLNLWPWTRQTQTIAMPCNSSYLKLHMHIGSVYWSAKPNFFFNAYTLTRNLSNRDHNSTFNTYIDVWLFCESVNSIVNINKGVEEKCYSSWGEGGAIKLVSKPQRSCSFDYELLNVHQTIPIFFFQTYGDLRFHISWPWEASKTFYTQMTSCTNRMN